MPATIDYYFYSASPFTYLGHQAIVDVAARHGAKLNIKPVNLFGLWEVSGAVPPPQRPPVRQRYRLIELQRVAEMRGLPINPVPQFFPVDATLADHTMIALVKDRHDPTGYMQRIFAAVWANEEDISDEAVLMHHLEAAGHHAQSVMALAKSDSVAQIRARNTEQAISADAVGVPAYVLNGEAYWGQDRIEYLDHALETGRAAFTPG